MKRDQSLRDLKIKNMKSLLKKLSNRIRFFYSTLHYETITSLFIAFRLLGTQN